MRCILLFAAAILLKGQDGCPPVRFTSVPSAALLPTASSHRIVAKQTDGSFTAFDLSNAAPHNLLHTIPHFDRQLRPCTPATTGLGQVNLAIGQPKQGGYLIAYTDPSGFPTTVTAYDASFNVTGETALNGSFPNIQFGDVNNDGNLDALAYTEPDYKNQIAVFLGNGGASFQAPTVVYLASAASIPEFAIADVNGDGKQDIVGVSVYPNDVFVLLGKGDGTFGAPTVAVPANAPTAFALGDLNGDGKLDLVISDTTPYSSQPGPLPTIDVALGLGNGAFSAPVQYSVGSQGPVAIGDLNGDGFPDIVTGSYTILFGDGKGNFTGRRDYQAAAVLNSPYSSGVIITDFNDDGIPDITSGMGNSSVVGGDTATVLLGMGNGVFAAPPLNQVPGLPQPDNEIMTMVSGDFNNDGIPDIAVSCLLGQVSVLLGAGTGAFTPSFTNTNRAGIPWSIAVADFNHDGNLDFAVAGSYPNAGVEVFLGDGKGAFDGPLQIATPTGAFALVSGDFNRDGRPDLALLTSLQSDEPGASDSIQIYLGNGDGTFSQGTTYQTGPGASGLVAGDFNGDGFLDLVVANQGNYSNSYHDANLTLFLGGANGSFAAQSPIALGSPYALSPQQLIAADFNRDGKLDLAFYSQLERFSSAPGVAVMLGLGGGAFQSPVPYAGGAANLIAGDINGDGILDLVSNGGGYRLGNGDGSFQALVPGTGAALLADFNGDGKLDAALSELNGLAIELNSSEPPPPVTVVSTASFAPGPLTPGAIATAYGNFGSVTSVDIRDATGASSPAMLLYRSSTQTNFVIPSNLDAGVATVSIGSANPAPIVLTPNAPQTFSINTTGLAAAYVTQVSSKGTVAIQPVFSMQNGIASPVPIDPTAGPTYLTFFVTGQSSPIFGGSLPSGLTLTYDGPVPSTIGLQQINLFVAPSLAGSGFFPFSFGGTPVYVVFK